MLFKIEQSLQILSNLYRVTLTFWVYSSPKFGQKHRVP